MGEEVPEIARAEVEYVNNYDFYEGMGVVDFFNTVGKHFRVSSMLARDSVKSRMSSEDGISFTEFSYQVFQAYDFMKLS